MVGTRPIHHQEVILLIIHHPVVHPAEAIPAQAEGSNVSMGTVLFDTNSRHERRYTIIEEDKEWLGAQD